MPQFASGASTAHPGYRSDVLVGDRHHVIDRPVAASGTYRRHELVVRDGATFRATTAEHRDAAAWAADTATALGAVVIPATRPVAASADADNTGDGTVTAAASADARAGLYRAVCVAEAGDGGTFRLLDPTGRDLGAVTVAVEATLGGLTLTIADGANDWDKGDVVDILVGDLHYYTATAVAGDTKTHAATEPTWPTDGSTVTDDQVTWTDSGIVDDLRDYLPDVGVLEVADAFTTGSGETPTMPVIQSGQVSRAEIAGLPSLHLTGTWLGHLLLEA